MLSLPHARPHARMHACATIEDVNTPRIITVASTKGGVGKTTLAYELAAALGAVLVDLDWDDGGATRSWGYDPERYRRAPLLDALEAGPGSTPPRPRVHAGQPALVPSHPDLASSFIDDMLVVDCLESWAPAWGLPYVVVDTHPGANPLTDGAMAAAHVVVSPVVLAPKEMAAAAEMMRLYPKHPLVLVPNIVSNSPPDRFLDALAGFKADKPWVLIAPPISRHSLLTRRIRRAALCLQERPGRAVARAATEFRAVAAVVAGFDV